MGDIMKHDKIINVAIGKSRKDVYVNLFIANNATLQVNGKKVTLSQTTSYPWNGDITLAVSVSA